MAQSQADNRKVQKAMTAEETPPYPLPSLFGYVIAFRFSPYSLMRWVQRDSTAFSESTNCLTTGVSAIEMVPTES